MGDTSIAQDILDGVADALGDAGDTRTLRIVNYGSIDPNDPGAAPTVTNDDTPLAALLFDFDEKYMPGANIVDGDTMSIIDLSVLSEAQKTVLAPGTKLIDSNVNYDIIKINPIEFAGILCAVILQLKVTERTRDL